MIVVVKYCCILLLQSWLHSDNEALLIVIVICVVCNSHYDIIKLFKDSFPPPTLHLTTVLQVSDIFLNLFECLA